MLMCILRTIMKCHWHSVYSRRRQSALSMATKCQSVDCREKEAVAKATKCQSAEYREREAQAMATKHESADYRESETQAMATKCQSEVTLFSVAICMK